MSSKFSLREVSQRQHRVNSLLTEVASEIIREGKIFSGTDEAISLFSVPITVTSVKVSPDLRNATIFVCSFSNSLEISEIAAILNRLAGSFKKEIAPRLRLKFVPNFTFKEDRSFDYAAKIDKILSEI